ncbi:hypothetical protein H8788_23705 [Parabacteroides faecis]|uniref:hypothetical protein n=1 Tax=Parabacteroides TaxID=375288 RepID=UPI000F000540|nr:MULTISPECIES: hypothetical protein [Parabacteroides]MBC8620743.1 hypothetical protein [Parabacteroides faecis]RHR92735.1 hypothetical protein DWW23_23435 [Parabacteroides sp. AF14-59]
MNLETLKKGNTIQENIVYLTKKLALLTEAINGITEEDTLYTDIRSSAWNEKIIIGDLVPGKEILILYRDRVRKKIDSLETEFAAL